MRESYLSILTDLRDGNIDLKSVRTLRDDLQDKLTTIYASAPRTNSKTHGIASEGLKNHEEMTFSDDEIDQFLPALLRKSVGENKK